MQQDVPVMTEPETRTAAGGDQPDGPRSSSAPGRAGRGLGAHLALRFELLGWSVALFLAAVVGGCVLLSLWVTSLSVVLIGVGVPLLMASTLALRWFADRHRAWAGNRLGVPVPSPYRSPPAPGWQPLFLTMLRDPASWRDLAWLIVNVVVGGLVSLLTALLFVGGVFYLIYPFLYWVTPQEIFGDPFGLFTLHSVAGALAVVPVGLVFFAAWYVLSVPLADLNAALMRSLLGPTGDAALRARVQQLATSRADTVDTQASELRRIERDLHDGAQARLASLGMSLGLAEQLLSADPEAARRLLLEARESTSTALVELRDLVRGIHPPVLADRGLDGAVQALALVNPVPTTVVINLAGRLPAPVESAAYFTIAEALANAIKHSGARNILITVEHADGLLSMRVNDDGRGGARIDGGGGLRGVERRLGAFDGTLTVDSPVGGPTEVRMSLPCALS
jgi:signal transduction histidine kinase